MFSIMTVRQSVSQSVKPCKKCDRLLTGRQTNRQDRQIKTGGHHRQLKTDGHTAHLFDSCIDIIFTRRFGIILFNRESSAGNAKDWDTCMMHANEKIGEKGQDGSSP